MLLSIDRSAVLTRLFSTLVIGLALLWQTERCSAESPVATTQWTQFRGTASRGVTSVALPIEFGMNRGLVWRTEIPGQGWSSPVLADKRLWFTTAITTPATPEQREARLGNVQMADTKEVAGTVQLKAICLDAETGAMVHNLDLATIDEPQPIHPLNSYASPTPVFEDGKLYCHFGTYGTWCLNEADGEVIWNRQLVIDHSVGPGGSPVLYQDLLLVVCDGIDKQFVTALDKLTGETRWTTPRPEMRATNGEFKKAYSTPLIIQVDGVEQAVVPGAQWIVSYEPKTGKEIWRVDHGSGFSISSTPIYTGDADKPGLVIFTTGYGQSETVAVDPRGQGDVTLSHIVWRTDRNAPAKPSPTFANGLVYLLDDSGILCCLNASDGESIYRKRVSGNYSASPLLAADYLYVASQEGVVTIIKAGEEFEEVAQSPLDARIMASPIPYGHDLIIRSEDSVMRFTAMD